MAIKHTTWTPEGCNCTVVYSWDTDHHVDVRKHTIVKHDHCGGAHAVGVVGEQLEGSKFHQDFMAEKHLRELFPGKISVR